jgi:hypothetical protein
MEESIEGSLDIFWENAEGASATPKYGLIFARYVHFQSGAQPIKHLVGEDILASYLIQIDFVPADAREWVKQVTRKTTVSIPHVFMPKRFLADYERPK